MANEKGLVQTDQQTWDAVKLVADVHKRTERLGEGDPRLRKHLPTNLVRVKNMTGADRRRGDVMELGAKLLDELTNEFLWFEGVAPSGTEKFGILRAALPDGKISGPGGDLQVAGVCMAWVDVQDVSDTRAGVVAGEHVLVSGDGPYKIMQEVSYPGEQELCVCLTGSGGGAQIIRFELGAAEDITCELCQANATVLSWVAGSPIPGEDYGEITVFDLLDGAFLGESPDELAYRKGYAARLYTPREECAIDPALKTKWEIISLACRGSCPSAY